VKRKKIRKVISMSKGALEGIKLVEYATMVSGPYCGKLLADLGAEVIKVEPPEGDPSRLCGPFPDDQKNPEKSALFLYVNTSKRGVTLDLNREEGLEAFKKLLCWADIFIENQPADFFESLGLNWEDIRQINPGLVYASITPYGRSGPRSGVKGDELTIIHGGGLANLLPARSADLSHGPVKLGGSQVGYYGGVTAAMAVMGFLWKKLNTGQGHWVDISLQQVMMTMVAPLLAMSRYNDVSYHRIPDRPPAQGRMETQDGYVILGAFDDHHFRAFRELMGKPSWAASDQWDNMVWRANHIMDIAPQMEAWMKKQKKKDITCRASEAGIPIGAVNTAEDVMHYNQYQARGYFVEVDHPAAGKYTYPGWPYKMTASPPRVSRPAPLLGQHNEEVFSRLDTFPKERSTFSEDTPAPATGHRENPSPPPLPLQGIRVLEFCWVWAGPYATMLLANLGAEVIRVEGHRRTDLMRRSVVWPRQEPFPRMLPPNQGMGYNAVNRDKKSVTLDLSQPEGAALARQLAAHCDVVIDNMRPDAMIKVGLGYEVLRQVKPDIIVISSSGRGHEGPEAEYLGFASIHQSIGGLSYISGHPDDHPTHGTMGDADLMNATATAFSALAALVHRRRTGEGQFIDYSQCEGVSCLIGEHLLGYVMNSVIPERIGNRHPEYAPHNVYRCWGVDRWLAIEVHTEEEFGALARVMGRPEWIKDPRFSDKTSRKKHEAELDDLIEEWSRQRDRDWMVEELCRAGVAAAPSRDWKDLYADRHLQARGAFVKINHPELGELELAGPPWKISDLVLPTGHAPLLGEHNQEILQGLLGLTEAQMADLRAKDIIV
jgi:crotonobetainyl-CoA:carnitine CoA-transferase CaiB-like acyl-CoA transferase